jgi:RNA binding exosome subunit
VIRRISFRAFVAATEDEQRVREALSIFVPLDSISTTSVEGHFGNEIKILEAALKKRDARAFFQILREQLPKEDLSKLRRETLERLDEDNHFHLRLDKQAAYKGMVRLTDLKDAIAVSAMVETYPTRREEALRIISELL